LQGANQKIIKTACSFGQAVFLGVLFLGVFYGGVRGYFGEQILRPFKRRLLGCFAGFFFKAELETILKSLL
jgi:F0F1-type ATP synthase membrane subunit a